MGIKDKERFPHGRGCAMRRVLMTRPTVTLPQITMGSVRISCVQTLHLLCSCGCFMLGTLDIRRVLLHLVLYPSQVLFVEPGLARGPAADREQGCVITHGLCTAHS